MPATNPPPRRHIEFRELSDILADARGLAARPCVAVGNWTFAQNLEHVAAAIDMGFDGTDFKAPWWARVLVAPLVKNWVLTRPMRSGFRLPRRAAALLPDPQVTLEAALAHLESAVARFESETPTHPHPFLGRLTKDEYVQLHLRHAALHLSFVVPRPA